ncbi:FKBP-type peptidyl-prolyl cis-trans isomerase [Pedobacter sp. UYP1]|jgi:FKBP-type peptidyl-prolyl cis-trans isomerase FkpA|uniref:FKBP-type peptidyl-prolyl cis-trans isomerase n=1 Tax=Pedobacter sp. UYP1 TaxID=1756396 RepID=UPI0033919259
MIKIKHLLVLLVCTVTAFTSCTKKNDDYDPDPQFRADTTAIRAFIIANKIPAVKDPKTGVFYQIITPGSGTVQYGKSTNVTANYTGRFLDGSIFDQSKGTPIGFTLGGVIPGWQIGVPFIQPGGRIRLLIPSWLGYGNQAQGPIPANSILDFTIDLVTAQ